jgi:hypothetical protein
MFQASSYAIAINNDLTIVSLLVSPVKGKRKRNSLASYSIDGQSSSQKHRKNNDIKTNKPNSLSPLNMINYIQGRCSKLWMSTPLQYEYVWSLGVLSFYRVD